MKAKTTVSFTPRAIFVNLEDALGHLWLPGEFFLIGSQWGSILFNQHLRERKLFVSICGLFLLFVLIIISYLQFENVSFIDVEHS